MIAAVRDQVTGVVLAGGQSLRMGGRNKALVEFHGKRLYQYAVGNLEACSSRICINANRDEDVFLEAGFDVVGDGYFAGHGPVAGLRAALKFASTPYVAIASCDQMELPDEVYRTLCAEVTQTSAVYAVSGSDLIPTCAVLPVTFEVAATAALTSGQRALTRFMDEIGRQVRFDHVTFSNLNYRHQVKPE